MSNEKKTKGARKMNLEDYKSRSLSKKTLPSGLVIEVRNLSPYSLMKVQEELKISFDEESYSTKLVDELFKLYVASPKIPDEIEVSEFTKEDYEIIHEAMFESVTFTEKSEEKEEIKTEE